MELLWLDDLAAQDITLVGGKVANLSRLAAAFRVPTGFCLTTVAFTRWAGAALDDMAVPPELHATLSTAYHALAQYTATDAPRIAVRSSALDEDGAGASFAGQYESFLNITCVEDACHAVLRCWHTARSERVLAYRHQLGLAPDGIKMAVLLQQMVAADASAYVFSANPISGDTSQLVINANWGLGASIADGSVTPDTYVVRKADLALVERNISDKQVMTVMVADGTREVSVPRFLRNEPALTDTQIVEICQLARMLEANMGWPVDVETAWSGDLLYLLQCRPVTTLTHTD
jgi:phosphoenolpyruvate synthase/pyruvate phosphate dikinase